MKPKTLLDTVYIVRLYGSDLFSKAMEAIKVHIVPAVLSEITSPRSLELERLIQEGNIVIEEISGRCQERIVNLIKRHKGKEHSKNYQKGRLYLVRDLGEFEIMAVVQEKHNTNYHILTFDRRAKKMMMREPKIKPSVVPENEEQQLLRFSDEEMAILRRGYS